METLNNTNGKTLAGLLPLAQRAHYWISFSPEKRGEQLIKDYQSELDADILFLTENNISEEMKAEYTAKFTRLLTSWLHAKSNCTSAMITGPANYNMRRHEKANRSESRHYEIFAEWRARAKKAIVRKAKPAKTYSSELERYRAELEGMKKNHELMKEGNKRIKEAHKNGTDLTEYLTKTFDVKPHMIEWMMKFGFGLSNNLANIKRVEDRIKLLEKKEAIAATSGNKETDFNGVKVVENYEIDRLQIIHESKPSAEVIQTLKSNGFKWSPSNKSWQRQLTQNAISALKRVLA